MQNCRYNAPERTSMRKSARPVLTNSRTNLITICGPLLTYTHTRTKRRQQQKESRRSRPYLILFHRSTRCEVTTSLRSVLCLRLSYMPEPFCFRFLKRGIHRSRCIRGNSNEHASTVPRSHRFYKLLGFFIAAGSNAESVKKVLLRNRD